MIVDLTLGRRIAPHTEPGLDDPVVDEPGDRHEQQSERGGEIPISERVEHMIGDEQRGRRFRDPEHQNVKLTWHQVGGESARYPGIGDRNARQRMPPGGGKDDRR